MSIEIPNRDQQHGGMEPVGSVSQSLKIHLRNSRNWGRLSPGYQEALDMIAHKIGRILSGSNPHDPEHWEDVAGYAKAAMRDREPYQPSAGTGGVVLINPPFAGGGQ